MTNKNNLPAKFKDERKCKNCGVAFIPRDNPSRIYCKACQPVIDGPVLDLGCSQQDVVQLCQSDLTEERVREIVKEELRRLNLDKLAISYVDGIVNIDSIGTETVKDKL